MKKKMPKRIPLKINNLYKTSLFLVAISACVVAESCILENMTKETELFTSYADSGQQDTSGTLKPFDTITMHPFDTSLHTLNVDIWFRFGISYTTCEDVPVNNSCTLTTTGYDPIWLIPKIELSGECQDAFCQ